MLKYSLLMKNVRLFLLALLFLSGCSFSDQLFQKTTEIPASGTVLFSDSFSSSESGWITTNQNGSFVWYQADGLRFFIDNPNLDLISNPGYSFSDVRIEVEAIKLDGPDNNAYGVICRKQDDKNYYSFVISSDGYAGIILVKDGVYQLLNSSAMEFAPMVNKGKAINILVITCKGNNLVLDINGENEFSIKDEEFKEGDIGLIAGSFEEPGVDIFFDNFTVIQP